MRTPRYKSGEEAIKCWGRRGFLFFFFFLNIPNATGHHLRGADTRPSRPLPSSSAPPKTSRARRLGPLVPRRGFLTEYPRKTSSGGGLLNKGQKEMREPEFQAKGTASTKAWDGSDSRGVRDQQSKRSEGRSEGTSAMWPGLSKPESLQGLRAGMGCHTALWNDQSIAALGTD